MNKYNGATVLSGDSASDFGATKIIYHSNGADDQDREEVLLSDSEKFDAIISDKPY